MSGIGESRMDLDMLGHRVSHIPCFILCLITVQWRSACNGLEYAASSKGYLL